jgi:mutator protein MutT
MELLDVYDNNGHVTGKKIIRGDKSVTLNDNEHIAVAVIYIRNSEGKYLIQKTSLEKGGEYSSTGGHINSGETPLEAIKREVFEEIGVNIDNDEIKECGYLLYDKPIRYMFYLNKDIDINSIKVQKSEVDFVRYMTEAEIKELIKNNEMTKSHGIIFNELLKMI